MEDKPRGMVMDDIRKLLDQGETVLLQKKNPLIHDVRATYGDRLVVSESTTVTQAMMGATLFIHDPEDIGQTCVIMFLARPLVSNT